MLEAIARAQRRIHFENYIIRPDAVGRRFAKALAERAARGVEVRLLYDWLGCLATPAAFWNELRASGIRVRCFAPPSWRRPLALLRRNHRKLVVVDGETAVVGGLCIGQEWTGREDAECWRDTAVRVDGPLAATLDASFAIMWRRAGGRQPAALPPPRPRPDDVLARALDGPPTSSLAFRVYDLLGALATKRLYITGAYPMAPVPLRRALTTAARLGVDVRLLVPGRSDLPLVNHAARASYAALLAGGVRIFQWSGSMLHAKTAVADGSVALVGSSNLNAFSLLGTYELDLEIHDARVAGELEAQFLADLDRSREITRATWRRRPHSQRWRERGAAAALWLPGKLYLQ